MDGQIHFIFSVVRYYNKQLDQQKKKIAAAEQERKYCIIEFNQKLFDLSAEHSREKERMQLKETEMYAKLALRMAENKNMQRENASVTQSHSTLQLDLDKLKVQFVNALTSSKKYLNRTKDLESKL